MATPTPALVPTHSGESLSPAADLVTLTPLKPGDRLVVSWIDRMDYVGGWGYGGSRDPGNHVLFAKNNPDGWRDVTPPHAVPRSERDSLRPSGSFLDQEIAAVVYDLPGKDPHDPSSGLVVWFTGDSGETWLSGPAIALQRPTSLTSPPLLRLSGASTGWLAVPHDATREDSLGFSLMHTDDRGATWVGVELSEAVVPAGCGLRDMAFAGLTGVLTLDCSAAVLGPQVVWTFDGGQSWERQALRPPPNRTAEFYRGLACAVHSPHLLEEDWTVLAAECLGTEPGQDPMHVMYETFDGREHWYVSSYPGGSLFAWDDGWKLATPPNREIYWRTPEAPSWRLVDALSWDGQFDFETYLHGWAVARDDGRIALLTTNSGGRVWVEIEPVVEAGR